ncbi:Hypothetical predicted protein [Octopus vulgaris]|uniref:Uncharacterized protein n=1 Tax=Octopus vulgaris TaxID=6645 RepID=A0AA36FHH5_OCTVU|nr:Hypothetical predicted protein [Octopus vulgaris]
MTPDDGIRFGETSQITMTCQYNAGHRLNFKLFRNDVIVVYLECHRPTRIFETKFSKDGFKCTLTYCNEGVVTCWKRNPTCKDVAYYKCGTSSENSKAKFMKAVNIVETTPAEGIEFGKTFNITCMHVLKNILDFRLQQNGTTVLNIQYHRKSRSYQKIFMSKGFDCDLPVNNIAKSNLKSLEKVKESGGQKCSFDRGGEEKRHRLRRARRENNHSSFSRSLKYMDKDLQRLTMYKGPIYVCDGLQRNGVYLTSDPKFRSQLHSQLYWRPHFHFNDVDSYDYTVNEEKGVRPHFHFNAVDSYDFTVNEEKGVIVI